MTMMEDQTAKGTDPLNFESKEIYKSNNSKMDTSPVAFEAKGKDECWNQKVMDDVSMDNENGTKVSAIKEDQNGLPDHQTDWEKDLDSLSSNTQDKDKEQRSPEHEILVAAEEFTNESRGTTSPYTGASDLFEKDTNLFSDKNVLECEIELPELEVCYKEINHHVVKDICVDEGRSGKDKEIIQNCKDDTSDNLVPQPCGDDYHFESAEVSHLEIANSPGANQCGSKVEKDGPFIAQEERLKSPSDSSLDKDSTKHCDPEDSSGAEAGGEPEQDVQTSSSLLYNSNVETGTITFNFNSPSPVGDAQDHQNANADDNPSNSKRDLHDQIPQHKDGNSDDFAVCGVQAIDPKHEHRASGNASVVNQLQYDGETSFSAASLISYSGPMVNSGSISHRSDGSAASTRSFAFPVLQNEWNSSPVRMAKADRRHFRKNKCWRSGLLCCRF